jgi:biopolymer transport protein TolR
MLVLLIIFMVTAPLSIGGINVSLPFSKAKGGSVDENRVVLSINKKGEYYLEKLLIPDRSLEERMQSIYQFRERKELYIRADTGVEYGKVVRAMSAAKLAGVEKMSMLTQPPSKRL